MYLYLVIYANKAINEPPTKTALYLNVCVNCEQYVHIHNTHFTSLCFYLFFFHTFQQKFSVLFPTLLYVMVVGVLLRDKNLLLQSTWEVIMVVYFFLKYVSLKHNIGMNKVCHIFWITI